VTEARVVPEPTHGSFVTEDDEISLRTARAQQSGESVPDTFEVRSDAVAIVEDQLGAWRRPVRLAVAGAVGVMAVLVLSGIVAGAAARSAKR